MVILKIGDYGIVNYPDLLDQAIKQLPEIIISREFTAQMSRLIVGHRRKNAGQQGLSWLSEHGGGCIV